MRIFSTVDEVVEPGLSMPLGLADITLDSRSRDVFGLSCRSSVVAASGVLCSGT